MRSMIGLAEAYSSFRWLGVRLLPVVSSARGRLVGVLTRSDLLGWSGTWLAERAAMDLDRDEAADDEAAAFDASRHSYDYDHSPKKYGRSDSMNCCGGPT